MLVFFFYCTVKFRLLSQPGFTAITTRPADEPLKISLVELQQKKPEAPQLNQTAKSGDLVKIQTKRFVKLQVVPAEQITETTPVVEELEKAVIGQINREGEGIEINNFPAENSGEGNGRSIETQNAGDNIFPWELIEKYPEFPGGMNAFAKFLQKNLHYPPSALENQISGRVTVSFIVEKDGQLTNIRILKGIGFGCDEEAVRVLKKSPPWTPGIQNKQKVRVQYIVPIVFRSE